MAVRHLTGGRVARCQNGLEVLTPSTTGPLPRLRKINVPLPGKDRHFLLRDGAVGFLLAHYALNYHETVERLNITGQPWDEWAYADRPVRDSTDTSNHAGGAALDLNSTLHVLGRRGTFTARQRRRMAYMDRVIYRGCIRSGEFYTKRVDGMHHETDREFKALQRNARRLCRTRRGKAILAANPGLREVIFS